MLSDYRDCVGADAFVRPAERKRREPPPRLSPIPGSVPIALLRVSVHIPEKLPCEMLLSPVLRFPPIDGTAPFVLICDYTGKEVVG
jgi:hypothetical protein